MSVRPIALGAADGERVAVASGLKAGDVVVTEGGDRLRDGAAVIAAAEAGAAGAATAPPRPGEGRHHGSRLPGGGNPAHPRNGKPPASATGTP